MKEYTNDVLVSVIVPIYNSEEVISKCLESIINQTYKNIEIILINDGSTDKTLEILERYEKIDKRIELYNQINQGVSVARNKGIEYSKGQFLIFIDADDWINGDYVQILLKHIREHNADIAICNSSYNNKGKITYHRPKLPVVMDRNKGINEFLRGNIGVSVCGKMYNGNFIHSSNINFPKGKVCEDSIWFFKNIMICNKIVYTPETYYNVFNRLTSQCNRFNKGFLYGINILNEIKEELIIKEKFKRYESAYKIYYQKMIIWLIDYGIRFWKKDFLKVIINNSKISFRDFSYQDMKYSRKRKIVLNLLKINPWFYCYVMKIRLKNN